MIYLPWTAIASPVAAAVMPAPIKTISWTDQSTPLAVRSTGEETLVKRHVPLTIAIQATWYYTCPIAGSELRVFKWKAHAELTNPQHAHITLTTIYHIDKFINLRVEGHNFHAYFLHGVCIPRGRFACYYRYQGKTTGWLDGYGIHMGHLVHSTDQNENPLVQEECIDTSTPALMKTCPAPPIHYTSTCTVDRTSVVYIDPPPMDQHQKTESESEVAVELEPVVLARHI